MTSKLDPTGCREGTTTRRPRPDPYWHLLHDSSELHWLAEYRIRPENASLPAARREHNMNLMAVLVAGPVFAAYFLWARHVGYNMAFVTAGVLLAGGIVGTLEGMHLKGRLYWLGASVPCLISVAALLIWQDQRTMVLNMSALFCAMGLGMGTIQACQLKQLGRPNDAD
jgi:hypothetical protein